MKRNDLYYDLAAVDTEADKDRAAFENEVRHADNEMSEFLKGVEQTEWRRDLDIKSEAERAANKNTVEFSRGRRAAETDINGATVRTFGGLEELRSIDRSEGHIEAELTPLIALADSFFSVFRGVSGLFQKSVFSSQFRLGFDPF